MTCRAIIPIKAAPDNKERLAGALDPAERSDLAARMLEQVVSAVRGCEAVDGVWLVGPSRHGLGGDIPLIGDPGEGLNAAVAHGLAQVAPGADRVLVIFADLPRLRADEVSRLAALPAATIGIAPDRNQTGTNALSLPLPAAAHFTFGFGPDSFARHCREAERLGLASEIVTAPGLAFDVDEPGDLAEAGLEEHRS